MASATQQPLSDLLAAAGLYALGTDPPPEAVEAPLRELARLLNGSDALRRTTAKSAAVRLLTAARVGRPAALVDAAFAIAKGAEKADNQQGQTVALADPEPWSEPVHGWDLLAELAQTFVRYIVLPAGAATMLALWVLHTYAITAAFVSPLLAVLSPQKRCGKTKLMTLLHALAFRAVLGSNITPAVLFRVVEAHRPTLLLDEADSFMHPDSDLRNLLNAGHTRAAAWVFRSVGDDHEPRAFSVWAAKAIARIGELPETLADRAVPVRLKRKAPGEAVEELRLDRVFCDLEQLRRKCARWTDDNLTALGSLEPEVPSDLNDRAQDNVRPLLAIADCAGGVWPERARKAARLVLGSEVKDDSIGTLLLADLRALFDERGSDRLASEDVVRELVKLEHRPWPEWRKGKPLSARQLARLLEPFGLGPKVLRIGTITARGYLLDDLADPFRRYLPVQTVTAQQVSTEARKPASVICNSTEPVTRAETPESPHSSKDVTAVTVPARDTKPGTVPEPLFADLAAEATTAEWEGNA